MVAGSLMSTSPNGLKVWTLDPSLKCQDTCDVRWGNVTDAVLVPHEQQLQLVTGSIESSLVQIHVVNAVCFICSVQ